MPSKKLVLFPAWPCKDWAVHFKLHAPGPTVLEGTYDGAGTLSNFSVSPPERKAAHPTELRFCERYRRY